MSTFNEDIMTKASTYLGYSPKQLSVDLAIEQFSDCRNYPSYYTDETILADMTKNISKIVMAVAEIDAKEGAEGETSHSESGTSRSYGDMAIPKAYSGVTSFIEII